MKQLEFNFFWPLTEQIPLGLDYTDCAKPQLTYPLNMGLTYAIGNGGTFTTCITASHLTIDSDTTTIKVKDKPNIIRRGLFNALGLKWELK
jgi:hypothetical protein